MKSRIKILTAFDHFFRKETALVLVLINLVLGTVYFLISDPFRSFQRTYDPFFPFKANEIERIQVGRKGHEAILEQKNRTWSVLIGEVEARPDFKKIASFLNAILNIRKFTKISSNSNSKEFGLNGEELKLEIQTESGEIKKLDIGTSGKSQSGTFIREPNTGEIWFVEENLNSLAGRGNENFFLSNLLIPENVRMQEIHTILIYSSENKNVAFEIEQTEPGNWKPISSNFHLCPGEDCFRIVQKILTLKAERVLKRPFEEKIFPLNPKDHFQIEVRLRSDQSSFLNLEWIGNTSDGEPIFRSDSDSILHVIDPDFLKGFREIPNLKKFFYETSDPF
ncbi:PF14238 domain protein [Leptospira weilii str. 2006001853]|uniref:PF14238 domain protein n=2 Tax=Leptospira weilii TaxID=28184 RepID=A0A828YY59_9LEPT|nr:DUF4340 domain-containing protein [Leptospira weilii]EMM71005.1 PF14238 domain protein [Leptospira weilii str. 2006001855]EKR62960.1 PF14238 domain protein [Leptospira weilii str. 2006001853]EMN45366.1 PF14238 domain protein [Leptospira weilii str. LNT 1234]MCL8267541.1 DUF4340 domain-containing protein [Leptospira weilii]QDK23213.1 DUF4340 domain-containing protein [Leptospira weilii]